MIRRFKYKPPLELFVSGLAGVLCAFAFLITEKFEKYDLIFLAKTILAIVAGVFGIRFIVTFIRERSFGCIIISNTFIQLPQYLLKPRQINFDDIEFVNERDGIIKISGKNGFDEIKRKFMIPAEFEELLTILKVNTKE